MFSVLFRKYLAPLSAVQGESAWAFVLRTGIRGDDRRGHAGWSRLRRRVTKIDTPVHCAKI